MKNKFVMLAVAAMLTLATASACLAGSWLDGSWLNANGNAPRIRGFVISGGSWRLYDGNNVVTECSWKRDERTGRIFVYRNVSGSLTLSMISCMWPSRDVLDCDGLRFTRTSQQTGQQPGVNTQAR